MATWKSIIVVVMLFVLAVAFSFGAYQIADASQDDAAAEDLTVTNETLVQQVGIYQLVSVSTDEYTARFNESVTVYNNSSVELTEGEDYEWNATDGAILFENTANTTDGEQANITYTYYKNTEAVRDINGPLSVLVSVFGELPTVVAGLGFGVMFFVFAALVMKSLGNLKSGPQSRR